MWNKIKDLLKEFKKWGFEETFIFLGLVVFYIFQAIFTASVVLISVIFVYFIAMLPYIFIIGAFTGFLYLLLKAVGIA